jgi:hypothetical protein
MGGEQIPMQLRDDGSGKMIPYPIRQTSRGARKRSKKAI